MFFRPYNIRYRKGSRGLILIEILVVMAIVLVFSSFVILSYGTYRKNVEITSAAQDIRRVLSTARTKAINQNGYFLVTINMRTKKVWIDESNELGDVIHPKVITPVILPDDVSVVEVRVNTFSYRNTTAEIMFKPNATADYSVIHLLRDGDDPDNDENYYSIRVFSSTGLAQIQANTKI